LRADRIFGPQVNKGPLAFPGTFSRFRSSARVGERPQGQIRRLAAEPDQTDCADFVLTPASDRSHWDVTIMLAGARFTARPG